MALSPVYSKLLFRDHAIPMEAVLEVPADKVWIVHTFTHFEPAGPGGVAQLVAPDDTTVWWDLIEPTGTGDFHAVSGRWVLPSGETFEILAGSGSADVSLNGYELSVAS